MNEESYSSGGEMLSDSRRSKTGKSKSGIPNFRFRRMTRRVPRTEMGEVLGGLAFGMTIIFPILSLLTVGAPKAVFGIIGIIALIIGVTSGRIAPPLIFIGICLTMIALGFVSLGILMMIIG